MSVATSKSVCLWALGASLFFLGPFVLMAESGGKDPRPELLLLLLLSGGVVVFGVRSAANAHPTVTGVLCVAVAALGWAPLLLAFFGVSGQTWTLVYGTSWLAALGLAVAAAVSSRLGTAPADT